MATTRQFETWRGIIPEAVLPPTVAARFVPREFIYPTYALELNTAAFGLLCQLVQDARAATVEPSDELLALAEAIEAIG